MRLFKTVGIILACASLLAGCGNGVPQSSPDDTYKYTIYKNGWTSARAFEYRLNDGVPCAAMLGHDGQVALTCNWDYVDKSAL